MELNELLRHFQNGEYDIVLNETQNSTNIDELFLRTITFSVTNQYEKAVQTIITNETIMAKDLARLIDTHMQICFMANEIFDAQEALMHYEEYPYVSQEVEEKFVYYKKEFKSRLKSSNKLNYDEESIRKMLESKSSEQIQVAFSELKRFEIKPFINDIQQILLSSINQSTRCLGLILLYEKKVNQPIKYNCKGKIIEVVPSKLKTPFEDPTFNKLMDLKKANKDTSYASTYETLLVTFYLYSYPLPVDEDVDDMNCALNIITNRYLGLPENRMRQKPNVERLIKEIEEANNTF